MNDVVASLRAREGCEPENLFDWDTIWVERTANGGGYFDWVLAGPEDPAPQRGGLRAAAALHRATIIQLFTDRRAPDDLPLPFGANDRRGWWGDSIRLPGEPERPLGSLLWTVIERGVVNAETERLVAEYAAEALEILAEQRAVARTEVETVRDERRGFVGLTVTHFDQHGARAYEQRFAVLWSKQVAERPAQMVYYAD